MGIRVVSDPSLTPSVEEHWRPIPGYEGYYEVSDIGNVRRVHPLTGRSARLLRQRPTRGGYLTLVLSRQAVPKLHFVHVLVAMAFIGPRVSSVDHIDANKQNNCVSNLEYVTQAENNRRARQLGLGDVSGERNHNTHLTADDVRAIRASTDSHRVIGLRYDIDGATVWHIKTPKLQYRSWKHIA